MNEDQIVGAAKNLGGKAEQGIGRAAGDVKSQVEGKARQIQGNAQELYGQAKNMAADAADTLRESAGEAQDYLREMIEQRPYTTAAIALGLGFLIGRLARRDV